MSTPRSQTKRGRLSTKLHTPGSVFGIRKTIREEIEQGNDSKVKYTIRPERLYFKAHDSDLESHEDYEELKDLIGKTWKVFRVSPLHNFEYTTVRMKQYGQRMREGLTTLLTDSTKDAHYEVNFSVAEGLTLTENDSEAVKILVNVMKRKNGEDLQRKHYIGFMVCRGASKALGEQSTIHLPVLLCSGTVRTIKSVHFLLQKFFDCSIDAYHLSQEDLTWLCALQADEDTHKGTSHVEMMFSFPQLSVRNRIWFKIPFKSLKYLWDSIHNRNSEYASFEEVERFYEAVQQQMFRVYELNVAKGQLVRIKTPTLSISNETKLMAKTGGVLNYVLKFLYEGSAIIETTTPALSVQPD